MKFTLSNINIATNGPITTKFYLYHHWGRGKAWLDRIGTLVSMATNNYNGVETGNTMLPLFSACFSFDPFILAGNNYLMHESSEEFEIWRDSTTDCGVSCPLALENSHRRIMGKTVLLLFLSCF